MNRGIYFSLSTYNIYMYDFLLLCFFLLFLRLLVVVVEPCIFVCFLLLRFAMHLSAMHHCSNNKMHIMFGLLCIPSFIWLSFLSPFLCCFVLYVHAHCICVIFTFEIDSSNVQTVWGKL